MPQALPRTRDLPLPHRPRHADGGPGLDLSLEHQNQPLDNHRSVNALAETVNGYYKAELIRGPARTGPWKTVEEIELATLEWVHWHNTQRLHGYLGDLPPTEFEQLHAARAALEHSDPGVLPVGSVAGSAAERLPQPHPDAVKSEIASEAPLEPSPVTAAALTAGAPPPRGRRPGQING